MKTQAIHACLSVTTLLVVALLVATPQTADAEQRWYQVEVIVFRDLAPDSTEEWPLTPGYPDIESSINLAEGPELSAAALDAGEQTTRKLEPGDASALTPAIAYAALKPDELTLQDLYQHLQHSGSYRPLLYQAWQQPGLGRTEASTVHLQAQDDPTTDALRRPRVDGVLTLRTSHFLHVDADLVLYIGDLPHSGNAEMVRLTETRRVKLNEIHYLDNPLFGVLVKVSPVQMEPVAEP